MNGVGRCVVCGRDPAVGYAAVNDDWYCHGDDDNEPTCYQQAFARIVVTWFSAADVFMEKP